MAGGRPLPEFVEDLEGTSPVRFLPCGRYRVNMEQARQMLVEASEFKDSPTREPLWDNLEKYLLRFEKLSEKYTELLEGRPLVHHLWLGGSYVSSKYDPDDIDLTVFLDAQGYEQLRGNSVDTDNQARKGKPGAKWLTEAFQRQKMYAEFGLEPHEVQYRPVPHVFRPTDLDLREQQYFQQRGRFDDWWQRCSPNGVHKVAPTLDTAKARRGYLEVTL